MHHSQGCVKFATQISPLLNFRKEVLKFCQVLALSKPNLRMTIQIKPLPHPPNEVAIIRKSKSLQVEKTMRVELGKSQPYD